MSISLFVELNGYAAIWLKRPTSKCSSTFEFLTLIPFPFKLKRFKFFIYFYFFILICSWTPLFWSYSKQSNFIHIMSDKCVWQSFLLIFIQPNLILMVSVSEIMKTQRRKQDLNPFLTSFIRCFCWKRSLLVIIAKRSLYLTKTR
jgi:hypothetical protein